MTEAAPVITRFAPSPSGLLHLGHAHAALFAQRAAEEAGGRFLLRIEDIDPGRCRPAFEAAIFEDLAWLGLSWEEPPRRQSDHMADYRKALEQLDGLGLLYPCFCTRKEIQEEIQRAAEAPHGPDGPLYPGSCRQLAPEVRAQLMAAGKAYALRLNMVAAIGQAGPLSWEDEAKGTQMAEPGLFGDVVLARKDVATSYHLAVTLDDADQSISLVTRGEDLFAATHVHRLLLALLSLPLPRWHHHGLLCDAEGRRLAKRHDALSLRALREAGERPAAVRAMAGFPD
jgi:glutamyl-Q tRNA(Asp) synthetase